MRAPIILPGVIVVTRIEGELLAVTHGLDLVGGDAQRDE